MTTYSNSTSNIRSFSISSLIPSFDFSQDKDLDQPEASTFSGLRMLRTRSNTSNLSQPVLSSFSKEEAMNTYNKPKAVRSSSISSLLSSFGFSQDKDLDQPETSTCDSGLQMLRTRSNTSILNHTPPSPSLFTFSKEEILQGWCSWCYRFAKQELVQFNHLSRNVYRCNNCSKRTLKCRWHFQDCPGLARSHGDWDDELCGVCDRSLEKWGEDPPLPLCGYCSWCFRKTNHCRLQANLIRRDQYECENCGNRTLNCITNDCTAFTRVHAIAVETLTPIPVHCAVHEGIISDWSQEEANREAAKARGSGEFLDKFDPYKSFAPERHSMSLLRTNKNEADINSKVYIDGNEFYGAVADSIEGAQHDVYMSFWHFSTFVYLKRVKEAGQGLPDYWRVDRLLSRKAKQGVKIYVILWDETNVAMSLFSQEAQASLSALHPNVTCIRHPPFRPLYWTHHQKFVVVDRKIAYIGGFDICMGRWDNQGHRLIDDKDDPIWPGIDYYNPHFAKPINLDSPFTDVIDRTVIPRMPWHDVSLSVDGEAAKDVADNFIQRWKHHIQNASLPDPIMIGLYHPTLTGIEPQEIPEDPNSLPRVKGTTSVKIIRSISEWSGGLRTERSIYGSYMNAIKNAQHYIYVENQYLSSSLAGGAVENKLMDAILAKIIEKIEKKEIFRVIFLLPQPESRDSQETKGLLKWQYRSINRGGNSILEQLREKYPDINTDDYISFFFLRNYDWLNGKPVTEKVFVHAKLIIVDDEVTIVASANFNDRSMLGDRDSELGVEVRDTDRILSHMNGQEVLVGRFAKEFRIRLWQEHLGLADEDLDRIDDPICDSTYYGIWMATAKANTQIYETVFPGIISNHIGTWEEFERSWTLEPTAHFELLEDIRGLLTLHPIDFLHNENMDTLYASVMGVDLYQ